jgi:Putative adhesin
MSATVPQPAPAHRTPLPIRRALFVVAALLALFLMLVGAYNIVDVASRHTTTERASFDGVRSLVIEDASDVRLTGAPARAPLEVVTRATEGLRTPERSVERGPGGELSLGSSCPGFFGGQCSVDYTISVPAGTVVRAEADAGDIVAERLTTTEPLMLDSSAGDVEAIDVTAPSIELSSSAGDVEGRGLSAERIDLHSSAGDVEASLDTPAQRLIAESSAGDVELLVPDVVYDLSASSSAGDVDARVASDPDSRRVLTAHSSAGDVSVAVRP